MKTHIGTQGVYILYYIDLVIVKTASIHVLVRVEGLQELMLLWLATSGTGSALVH